MLTDIIQALKNFARGIMQAIEAITNIRAALDVVKGKGLAVVEISSLEEYLNALAQDVAKLSATSDEVEKQNHEYSIKKLATNIDVWKSQLAYQATQDAEMFKSVIEAGQTALKSASLINGGAAVALLACLGNLLAKDPPSEILVIVPRLASALYIFVLGVGFAGVATAIRYLSQAFYSAKWEKRGKTAQIAAITFAVASFVAFFWGGIKATQTITNAQITSCELGE
jgi:hypothetical protein